jgi:hypothetical protein
MKSTCPKKSLGLSALDINKEFILQEKSQNQLTFTFTKEQSPTSKTPIYTQFESQSTSDSKKLEDDDTINEEPSFKKPKRRDASSNLLACLEQN